MLAGMMAVLTPYQVMDAWAANAKLTFSDPSVTVGNEVSVTMKITSTSGDALGGADVTLTYDSSVLEFISGTNASGGAGSIRVLGSMESTDTQSFSFTLKFKALQAGSAKISVSTQEIYDVNTQAVTLDHQGSSTVTVNPLATYSKDATLKSLKVSPGTLTPEFSTDVESYTVDVAGDVDKIAVSAEPNDSKAKLVITGHSELQVGENTVTCKVTAEDGQTVKNYTILVNKSESIPDGSDGTGAEGTGEGNQIAGSNILLTVLPMEEGVTLPEGFELSSVTINDQVLECYIWSADDSYSYCIFYGQNQNGEKGFYRYDLTDKTIQKYYQDPAADTGVSREGYEEMVNRYNSLVEDYDTRFIIIVVLIGISAVLVVVVILLLVKKGGQSDDDRYDDGDEETEDVVKRRRPGKKAPVQEEELYEEEDLYEEEEPYEEEESYEAERSRREVAYTAEEPEELEPEEDGEAPMEASDEEEDDFEFMDLD